jgi:peptide/nickel transport system permease protein
MRITLFLLRRLAGGLALLVVLSMIVFGLLYLSPGSTLQVLMGSRPPSPALVQALNAKYHLNEPVVLQYWHWLEGAAHFNFGVSISVQTGTPVTTLILDRVGLSAELALFALIIVVLVGIPLGMLAGIRRGRATDRGISLVSTAAVSAPAYVTSILGLYVFGVALGWFPVYGVGTGFAGRLGHLTLPALILAALLGAIVVRQTRAAVLDVVSQDYITFARLRGLRRGRILLKYTLRNAAVPVLTSAGLLLIIAITAGLFIEQVFSLPGAGTLLLTAVTDKDIPTVQGLAMALGILVVVVNLLVDVGVLILDPRTRFSTKVR